MAWIELRQRGGDTSELMKLLQETKENLEDICEMVGDMDEGEYGERSGMGMRYDGPPMRSRRAYRIIQDDDDYGERRGVRGSGRRR